MSSSTSEIREGVYNAAFWDRFDFHLSSYVKTPLQLRYISSKTSTIGRALRHAVVDLLDNIRIQSNEYIENETTVIGTEHRLYHSREYTLKVKDDDDDLQCPELKDNDDKIQVEISSLAPTVFQQLRKDIGISNDNFLQSFSHHLKDFTNPGKSGSLMYKTFDDLFILKTLRDYEARLLMQILSGYHLQLIQRSTLFNRYIGLYSIRLQTSLSTIEIFVGIMANAFTPSLTINEIFDLKGSKIKRKLTGHLSADKLHKLKDMDFMELYPGGIRIPTNIYQKLKIVIANDAKVLKKLNITDFSLILGIRHLDMSEPEMMQRQQTTGVAKLLHMTRNFALVDKVKPVSTLNIDNVLSSLPISYLKPLEMINETLDMDLCYNNDPIANTSLPIPGIINKTNQRVYLYFVFVDMLQTFDSFKLLDQTFRKLKDFNRHLDYSVIEPDQYEKRINQFLFEHVFIDAQDDFPWARNEVNELLKIVQTEQNKIHTQTRPNTIKDENSVIELRF